jgi:TP901 family phage tail tape measure protein
MADEIVAVYRAEVEQYKKAVDELVGKVDKLDKEQRKATTGAAQMGIQISNVGKQIISAFGITTGIAGFVSILRNAIKISADFEAQMSKVRAVSGATNKEMAELEKTAKQLGASTMFTATQVGQLQEEYAKLGFTTEQIQQATAATLDLAAATGSSLAQAAEVAGATVQGFGLDAAETVRVTDVMAQSFNRSALDIERFKESIKLVAPIARAANIDLETTTALLGELANAGLSGSIAGTALKNLLSKLSDENSDLSRQLGFAVKNSDDLFLAFEKLAKMNIDLTAATELTDERSKAAFITLFNGIDTVKELDVALRDAAGSTKEMARIMQDNLQGSLTILSSAYEGFILKVMEGNGLLKDSVDAIATGLSKYTEALSITEQTGFKALDVALLLITANGKLKEAQEAATIASAENAKQLALDNAEILKALGSQADAIREVVRQANTLATLNEELKLLKENLENTEIGSKAFFEAGVQIEKKAKEIEAAIRSLRLAGIEPAGLTLLNPKAIKEVTDVSLKSLNDALAKAKKNKDEAFEFGGNLKKAEADILALEKRIKSFNDEIIEGGYNVRTNVLENVQEQAQADIDARDENLTNAQMFFQSIQDINNAITSAIMAGHEQEQISLDNQLEAGQISREQYDQRRRQLEREKAQDAKTAAIFNAVIGTALAVVNALAVGPPQGYILAAISAALGAVEIGVISAQPLPQFATGVIGLQGAGTETSDSIHARLSKGESVMTAAETRKYRPILEGIRRGTLDEIIRENYVRPAIDTALLNGFADMGQSADLNGITAKLSDHNIIAAMDRNRSATVYGLKMLADKLDKRTPKRGGYA